MAEFPLKLEGGTFEGLDDLVNSVFDEYQDKVELTKGKKVNIKITDALWSFGITDNNGDGETMVLADYRTVDILKKYDFFQSDPSKINNSVWFEAVSILNRIKPRMF